MNGWTVTAQLYRRSGDPEEGRDLHDAEPERVRAMRASLASRIASSAARRVADSGPEIGEPRPGERAELEALGYLAPGGASGASLELPLDRPRTEGPDMRAPLEQDRIVHAIHMRSLEGRPTGAEARAALERAAEVYAAWADAHPEHVQRATWRLRELARITARVTAAEPAGPAPGSAHRRGGDPR